VCDGFYCFCGAAPQRMNFNDITSTNVRQQGADGYLLR